MPSNHAVTFTMGSRFEWLAWLSLPRLPDIKTTPSGCKKQFLCLLQKRWRPLAIGQSTRLFLAVISHMTFTDQVIGSKRCHEVIKSNSHFLNSIFQHLNIVKKSKNKKFLSKTVQVRFRKMIKTDHGFVYAVLFQTMYNSAPYFITVKTCKTGKTLL